MDNLFPITEEDIESLRKQIKELEKTLRVLKQRLEFYEQQNAGPKMYQGGVMSPADLEQAQTTIISLRHAANTTTLNTVQGF